MGTKRKVTLEEWEAMKRYCVVANVKLYSEKNSFLRVFGPYETRSKAVTARARYKRQLDKAKDPYTDGLRVESYTISTTTIFSDEMFSGGLEIENGT